MRFDLIFSLFLLTLSAHFRLTSLRIFPYSMPFHTSAAVHIRKKSLGEKFDEEYSCCQMESMGYEPCCFSCCGCWKSCPLRKNSRQATLPPFRLCMGLMLRDSLPRSAYDIWVYVERTLVWLIAVGLCTEAWCCTGLSLSFTRIHAMQKFNVRP